MAIGDFYTAVILIALGAAATLYAMAKRCTDTIENLENSKSHEWYLIQNNIWTTDIKVEVEELHSFIEKNISESESEDKFIELFSDKEKTSSLRNRLNRLNESYNDYLSLRSLFPNLINEHEASKKWLIRTIVICFAFTIWGATGFFIETKMDFLTTYEKIFWFFFCLLVTLSIISLFKIVYHNRKCESITSTHRKEKSKYGDIIEKV